MNQISILQRLLQQMAQALLKMQEQLNKKKPEKRAAVFETAKACLGKNMAPIYGEYGCAESVNNVFKRAIGEEVGGGPSTYRMYLSLQVDKRFLRVPVPVPGDIVISPTGFGSGKIPNGHVGIMSDNQRILSNNGEARKWDEHWDLKSWEEYYKIRGGFPIYYFLIK